MKLHLNQEFTITKEWTADSKSPKTLGIPTIHIVFKGVLDNQEYRTYIVEGFKNNALWVDILSRPYKQLLIRFNTGRLRGNVIDADSEPIIVATRDQLQNRLNDIFE
jgi:hypothetical protein